jgi:hypothetical protein
VHWFARLEGDSDALDELASVLADGQIAIHKQAGSYFLTANHFNDVSDADEVLQKFQGLVASLGGFGLLYLNEPTSIHVAGIRGTNEDGSGVGIVQFQTDAVIQGPKAGPSYRPDLLVTLLWKSVSDELVAKASRLWSTGVFDWVNLYRLYEVIKEDVGGRQTHCGDAMG